MKLSCLLPSSGVLLAASLVVAQETDTTSPTASNPEATTVASPPKPAELGGDASSSHPSAVSAPTSNESKEQHGDLVEVRDLGVTHVLGQRRKVASATRVATPLIDIPMGLQVVDRELLQKQQVRELGDALRNVSGVYSPGTYSGGYTYFFLRGWWASNVGNYRRNGLEIWHLGHPYNSNVERVEILKGPASILYGDLEPGGAINLVTKKPSSTPSQTFQATLGSYELRRLETDITGTVQGSSTTAYRLNASYEQADSWRDVVNHKTIFVAPALTFMPLESLEWTLEAEYKKDDRVGDPGFFIPNNTLEELKQIPLNRFYGEPYGTYDFEDRTLLSTLEFKPLPGLAIRNTLSANYAQRTPFNIYLDGLDSTGRLKRSQYFYTQNNRTLFGALDIVGNIATGPVGHQFLAGVDVQANVNRAPDFMDRSLDSTMSLDRPVYQVSDLQFPAKDPDPYRSEVNKYGVYVQDQLAILDGRFQALLGLRYNILDNRLDTNDASDFAPRVGLLAKPTTWLSTYASYTRSFQPNFGDKLSGPLDPTYSTQYEAGLKADLLERKLSATFSLFQINKDDIVNWIEVGDDWIQKQGGTQRSRGVELDVQGKPLRGLYLAGSYGFVKAVVVEDPNFQKDNSLPFPEHTASLWMDVDVPGLPEAVGTWNLGAGAFYRGEYFSDETNTVDVPQALTLDLGATWTLPLPSGAHRIQANVQNVTDERVYNNAWGTWEFGRPRTWQVSWKADFR